MECHRAKKKNKGIKGRKKYKKIGGIKKNDGKMNKKRITEKKR